MTDDKAARLAAIRAANQARASAPAAAAPTRPSSAALDPVEQPPSVALPALLTLLLSAAAGAFAAAVVLPAWLPALSASLLGPEPKAYWYLSRASAFAAFGLLWLSMVFGLLMTGKLSRAWPGGPAAFELHQHTSLLGLAFALFHGLILLGDRYVQASLAQVLVPFAYAGHQPLWVGLGQLALYGLAAVGLSFYAKERIGRRMWRLVHFASFAVFALSLAHGIWSGSDTAGPPAQALYWAAGASVLFLTVYRAVMSGAKAGRHERDSSAASRPARS